MKANARQRFEDHRRHLIDHEPGLTLTLDENGHQPVITGDLEVQVGAGVRRRYLLEIRYRDMSPFKVPTTRETAGAIAWEMDRHISPIDGTFCMWLPQTAPRDFDTIEGLALHLDRVREFLLLQVLYDDNLRRGRTPAWKGPAWGHGAVGHQEWVREQIVGLNAKALSGLYRSVVKAPHPGARCPCLSGRNVRTCHAEWLRRMRHAASLSDHVLAEVAAAWKERRVEEGA